MNVNGKVKDYGNVKGKVNRKVNGKVYSYQILHEHHSLTKNNL